MANGLRALVPLAVCCVLAPLARAQAPIDGFDPNADGNVYALVVQPDGKIIIGGGFTHLQPHRSGSALDCRRIARLNADGSLDTTFAPAFDGGDVRALALQADGKILVGGSFTEAASTGAGAYTARRGLVRLNPDGTLDDSFQPNPGEETVITSPLIRTIAVQADGRILVGGGFTTFQPAGTASPITRNHIARLNANGTVDASFDPNANNVVLALAVQRDGRILIGGGFTKLGSTEALRFARLEPSGAIDSTFVPLRPDNRVLAIALQADGKILLGGDFRFLTPGSDTSSTGRGFLARLNTDGSLDTNFAPTASASVDTIAIEPDGKILLGGKFTWLRNPGSGAPIVDHRYIGRLNPDGTMDENFSPRASGEVTSIAVQSDTGIVLGGYFTSVLGNNAGVNVARGRIARIHHDGSLDTSFAVDAGGQVGVLARQPDGKIIVAGNFQSFAGNSRANIARIDATGALDASFYPILDSGVLAVAVQSDGKIIVGGQFSQVGDDARSFLARLNADGTLDKNFDPKPNGIIDAISIQSDGKILIGGAFTTLQPNGASTTTARQYLARLNADGSLDTTFYPNPSSQVLTIVPETEGKILVGGAFTAFQRNATGDTVAQRYIARINSDGSLDPNFAPNPDNAVSAIALQSDGKILIGGAFLSLVPKGATVQTQRLHVARINTDGSLDDTFDAGANAQVSTIGVLPDGKIMIGGSFNALRPNGASAVTLHRFFAWLNSDGTLALGREFEVDSPVSAILVGPGAKALVAGSFTSVIDPSDFSTLLDDHLLSLITEPAELDAAFHVSGPAGGGSVGALAFQPDGKLIAGGSFNGLAGSTSQNIARVFADGIPDGTFRTRFNGAVHAVLVLPERTDNVTGTGPLAWLNADGSFRSAFSRVVTSQLIGTVNATAVQSDGRLLVGGKFTINNDASRENLVRLNADGTLDTTFNAANPNEAVNAIAVQSDGKILLGGAFTQVAGQTRNYIARLNADGSLDSFDPNANGAVVSLNVLSGGKILVGGTFTTLQPNGATTSTARTYLARLDAAGAIDTNFNPSPNSTVRSVVVQSDGSMIVGGFFTAIGSTTRNHLARLDANGGLDGNFNPNSNGNVNVVAAQADGKLLVGGAFSTLQPNGATDVTNRSGLARLNADGTLDTSFDTALDAQVNSIAVQSDGAILIGGGFTAVKPASTATFVARNRVARLKSDGTVDTTFNPNANSTVQSVALNAADGSIIVAGAFSSLHPEATVLAGGVFTSVDDSPLANLARLSSDGTPDVNFQPAPNGAVHALAMQTDGRVLVAGDFTNIAGTARQRLARLEVDGTLDTTFAPQIDGAVYSLALQPDGRILIGGDFANVGGSTHQRLARLAANGAVDATFSASADARVSAIAVQADGRVLVAGEFGTIDGVARARLARLESNGALVTTFNPGANAAVWSLGLQADGKILAGGAFTQISGATRAHLARLLADGTLDTTFTAEADREVQAIALQADGRPTIGGQFSTVGGLTRNLLARIPATTPATQSLVVSADLKQITWTRGGPAGELSSVVFAFSTDNATWTDLGTAARTGPGGAWQLTGLNLPASSLYYIRARSITLTSRYASSSFLDTVWQFFGNIPAGSSSLAGSLDTSGENGGGSSPSGNDGNGSGGSSSGGGSTAPGGDGSAIPGGSASGASNSLVNLSVRVQVGNVDPIITGFVVGGSTPQRVLVRAVGPGLAHFNVSGPATAPQLALYDSAGNIVQSQAAWGGDQSLIDTFKDVGAFQLDPASADSAVVLTLQPGSYTIHARDGVAPGGIVLAEVYEATQGGGLANLSARGPVGTGSAVFIGGFIVGGDTPRKFLIRGVGPGLLRFHVDDAIADPSIRVFSTKDDAVVAENDDWGTQAPGNVTETVNAISATHAFSLDAGSKDSAVVVTLPPGGYTVHLAGTTAGSAMVEVYEVP